jgi:hypothetical protein
MTLGPINDPTGIADWSQAHAKATELLRSAPNGRPFLVAVATDTEAGLTGIGEGDNHWFRKVELRCKQVSEELELGADGVASWLP